MECMSRFMRFHQKLVIVSMIAVLLFCGYLTIDAQVLFPYNKETKLFDSYKGERSLGSIIEDDTTDTYFEFTIIKKKKRMVFVDICAPDWDNIASNHEYSCKISRRAWVRITDTKIYGRIGEGEVYLFYTKPKYNSRKISFDINEIENYFQVIDICGSWLKVQFHYNGKKFKLWLPPESQCISITNECT